MGPINKALCTLYSASKWVGIWCLSEGLMGIIDFLHAERKSTLCGVLTHFWYTFSFLPFGNTSIQSDLQPLSLHLCYPPTRRSWLPLPSWTPHTWDIVNIIYHTSSSASLCLGSHDQKPCSLWYFDCALYQDHHFGNAFHYHGPWNMAHLNKAWITSC